jgi:hypothetical protein
VILHLRGEAREWVRHAEKLDLAAREVFGDAWMDTYTTNPRAHP